MFLLVADPLETLNLKRDGSLAMARAALERGHQVDYLNIKDINFEVDPKDFLKNIPIRSFENIPWPYENSKDQPMCKLGKLVHSSVEKYKIILQRKDPPVDDIYIKICKVFSEAPENILQINNPRETYRHLEHLMPHLFPDWGIPTFDCKTEHQFVDAVRNARPEAVCKPSYMFSGHGIDFFQNDTPEEQLKNYFHKWKHVVVQPFRKAVVEIGDLRILTFDGHILGCLLRKPPQGSKLANLVYGGTGHFAKPTEKQRQAVAEMSPKLTQMGIHLVGFDFIGDEMSEINITCPTGILAIGGVENKRVDLEIIELLEKKISSA